MTGFLTKVWHSYSSTERHNIAIYIIGIMFYKFGLECFVGSITTLASDRFQAAHTFTKLGAAQGLNQAAQCIGAILIAPLIKKWPTRSVLSCAILFFGLMTTILLIVDAATGGSIRLSASSPVEYGSWNPSAIFIVWTLAGVAYGMVELIRRVIPADIVGGHVGKLRRLDATVHIFYEISGTGGAFASSAAISRFGNNYSFFLTPVFFTFAGITWALVSNLNHQKAESLAKLEQGPRRGPFEYLVQVVRGAIHFGHSVFLGAKLVLSNRRFIWLFPGYALALYLHRFLENSIAPAFCKRVLSISAWSQIIVGLSNLGELLGALTVFMLSDVVHTPLPWLRLDALMLNLVWVVPYFAGFATKEVSWAWRTGGLFIAISYGWAAGDISLAAYIQAAVKDKDFGTSGVSALGAVMAFLYSSYIITYAILSVLLGHIVDNDFEDNGNIVWALRQVGGLQFSVCSGIIIAACFIPRGAFALNPQIIGDIKLEGDPVVSRPAQGDERGRQHSYETEDWQSYNTGDWQSGEARERQSYSSSNRLSGMSSNQLRGESRHRQSGDTRDQQSGDSEYRRSSESTDGESDETEERPSRESIYRQSGETRDPRSLGARNRQREESDGRSGETRQSHRPSGECTERQSDESRYRQSSETKDRRSGVTIVGRDSQSAGRENGDQRTEGLTVNTVIRV